LSERDLWSKFHYSHIRFPNAARGYSTITIAAQKFNALKFRQIHPCASRSFSQPFGGNDFLGAGDIGMRFRVGYHLDGSISIALFV
jgi:hypothetical protein